MVATYKVTRTEANGGTVLINVEGVKSLTQAEVMKHTIAANNNLPKFAVELLSVLPDCHVLNYTVNEIRTDRILGGC
jgi:hypothetical protein